MLWALESSDVVTLTIYVDGTAFTYTIASTAGVYAKVLVESQVMKGKSVKYVLTSPADFRVFPEDVVIKVRPWGNSGPYVTVRPLGAQAA